MTTLALAVLAGSFAAAAPAPKPSAPAKASTAPAASPIAASTYTVSTLYTGDRVRDPFLPPSVGGHAGRPAGDKGPLHVDIHTLQLRGIMQDGRRQFALFSTASGLSLMLRGGRLYDDLNNRIPGITGRIRLRQKRAVLITADKDVQIFDLGEKNDQDGAR